jgi:alkanesulfonate monooxygenase SsuD/methylene tetrahydromethanopterin reductase-like flavin-dependent oxidoreductase (luciferase family)
MHQMWAPTGESDASFYRRTVTDVVLADQLGFDSVWIAEHHYVRGGKFFSRVPNAELFLATLINQTERIRLATGIKLLILEDPERTAENLRLLNVLSGNRVIFGLGQGSPDEMGIRTLSSDEKRSSFRTRLQDLARYIDGGNLPTGLALTPESTVTVAGTLWIGVRDDVSVAQAADIGANFIMGEAELAARQAGYVSGYRSAGGTGEARGARLVCVADTHEQAVADARLGAHALNEVFSKGRYHQEMAELGLMPATAAVSDDDVFARLEYAVGTPDEVTAQLTAYIETTGVNALNIMVHAPGISPASTGRSMRLFMSEVAPALLPVLTQHDPGS